ncbi:MAG: hypothetical protein CBC22_03890 [Alphaproteobacteria bacterium TMED62]|nr:MAG: hypothetical protein CBC22_03890 [Alphaproteobacteria bacterium TMED62]|tara:strand:- start:7889 stop:8458 length:570 start_codon:yes stop_codon:yes gene_type:complete
MLLNGNFVKEKAIFLDRDGVLNKPNLISNKPFAPNVFEDFILYEDAKDVLQVFKKFFFKLIVVTNQKDVGKGIMSKSILEKMHTLLKKQMPIDEILVCTCIDECDCYKPNPGMLLEAKKKWNLDIDNCFIIGDSWRDIGAGINFGCKTIFIDRKYNMPMPYEPDFIVSSLSEAKNLIIKLNKESEYESS